MSLSNSIGGYAPNSSTKGILISSIITAIEVPAKAPISSLLRFFNLV